MIVSIEELLHLMGKSDSDSDKSMLMVLLDMAEDTVKQHVGYSILQPTDDYVTYLPAQELAYPQSELFLPEIPVRSITSIYEDADAYFGQGTDAFPASSLLTAGTDYYLDKKDGSLCLSGRVFRPGGWSVDPGSIKVTYSAGYTQVEINTKHTPIKMAITLTAIKFYRELKAQQTGITGSAGPVVEETLGEYSVKYVGETQSMITGLTTSIPSGAMKYLEPYRRLEY